MKSGFIGRLALCVGAACGGTALGASILGILLSGAPIAQAAALDPKAVAGDALWYVHVDVDAARKSPIAHKIHEEMLTHDRAKRHLQELKDKFDFDPTRDLHSITHYGKTLEPHRGVMLIKADVDRAVVLRQLKEKPDFKSTTYGDHELYSWTERRPHHRHSRGHAHRDAGRRDAGRADDKTDKKTEKKSDDSKKGNESKADQDGPKGGAKARDADKPRGPEHTVTISFAKDGLVVVGHSLDAVKAGLDVIDGKTAGLSPLAVDANAGAILQAKATGLANAKLPFSFHSPVLANTERLSVSLTDVDGTLSANVALALKTAEVAGQIQDVVAGFRALAQLRHGGDDGLKAVFDQLQVETSGSVVNVHWEMSDEQVLKIHDKMRELRKQSRERWEKRQSGKSKDDKSQGGSDKSK